MDILPENFEKKFTERAYNVIAQFRNVANFYLADFLLALYKQKGSLASNFLGVFGFKFADFKFLKKEEMKNKKTRSIENIIEGALLEAVRYKHNLVGTQHLLSAAIYEIEASKCKNFIIYCRKNNKSLSAFKKYINEILNMAPFPIPPINPLSISRFPGSQKSQSRRGTVGSTAALDQFGVNLTLKAARGELEPIIGREAELQRIIQILARKTKFNPILIGEPGVGKTAIVYKLAQKIASKEVPYELSQKQIYEIRLSSIVAGSMFRGDFEARLEAVINEALSSGAILFIDEIHNVIGAGSAMGSLDAANILKPILSQGTLQIIGATTLDEYRKYIERDKALERRFQPVYIPEPSTNETKEIIMGLKIHFENHHGVIIPEETVDTAIKNAQRYIPERFMPDKVIDIIDETAAYVRSQIKGNEALNTLQKTKQELEEVIRQKDEKVKRQQFDEALKLKKQETELKNRLIELESKFSQIKNENKIIISPNDVLSVVSRMTGVPLNSLTETENEKLKRLEKDLKDKIIGQNEAIEALSHAILRSRAGMSNVNRPLGSFLFMGPTGVGKTELAKVLSQEVFGEKSLIKFDMSEFSEPHTISRLIGAPAGYVGYGEGGQLTEKVRHKPYSVVLFDEIEKAHPSLFNLLLQVLEEGKLTDQMGRVADFKNTIIILTSNLGTDRFTQAAAIGFEEDSSKKKDIDAKFNQIKEEALEELKEVMRPEFLNRLDEIIVFNPLAKKQIREIVKKQMKEFVQNSSEFKKIKIYYDKTVLDFITEKSFEPYQGARLVRKTIQKYIEDLIAEKLIQGEIKEGNEVILKIKKGKIEIEKLN